MVTSGDRLKVGSTDFHHLSGRAAKRAKDAQGTPTPSYKSPNIQVYKNKKQSVREGECVSEREEERERVKERAREGWPLGVSPRIGFERQG